MKTLIKTLFICCIVVLFSENIVNAQAKISLYLDESNCTSSPNSWHYKVTIWVYSDENCTGNVGYCYFISEDDYTFQQGEVIGYEYCNITGHQSFKVWVAKYDNETSEELCYGLSPCYSYYELIPVYVSIADAP